MINRLRIIILVGWGVENDWFFPKHLRRHTWEVSVRHAFGIWKTNKLQRVAQFMNLIAHPLFVFLRRGRYDLVITWSMRRGIIYGLINRLLRRRGPVHILRDFHINLIRKDFPYRLRLFFLRRALPGIDYFLCTSRREEAIYSRMFGISKDRIRFNPEFVSDEYFAVSPLPRKDYIFAYGNSDRDFDTLVRAARHFDYPVLILSQRYKPGVELPENVSLIDHRVSGEELTKLIISSRMVVIPMNSYWISAGQNSVLEAMALGRPMVVTANMATVEYVTHKKSAFFAQAGDVATLTNHIHYLWQHPDHAESLGKTALHTAKTEFKRTIPLFIETVCGLLGEGYGTRQK